MTFRIAAISKGTNAFGLKGIILVAKNGEVIEVGKRNFNAPEYYVGNDIEVLGEKGKRYIPGTEIPKQMPSAPKAIVLQIYPELNPKVDATVLEF